MSSERVRRAWRRMLEDVDYHPVTETALIAKLSALTDRLADLIRELEVEAGDDTGDLAD